MTENTEPKKALSIFDFCETDTGAEEEGRWFKNVMGAESGVHLKIRRMTSKKSAAIRRRLEVEFRKFRKGNEYPEAIQEKMLIAQLSEGILLGWEGINDRDGSPIPFSIPAAATLLEQLPAFRLAVTMLAMDMDNFRVEASEEILKN